MSHRNRHAEHMDRAASMTHCTIVCRTLMGPSDRYPYYGCAEPQLLATYSAPEIEVVV